MGLTCTVGGVRGTFEDLMASEVVGLIDQAFGADRDWDGWEHCPFGELDGESWAVLKERALVELGAEELSNLLAIGPRGRGVYLPANFRAIDLPLSVGEALRCASLTGLRRELFALADRWGLPADDEALTAILADAEAEAEAGGVADAPEVHSFARLMLAANEAMRRDCPLWLVG